MIIKEWCINFIFFFWFFFFISYSIYIISHFKKENVYILPINLSVLVARSHNYNFMYMCVPILLLLLLFLESIINNASIFYVWCTLKHSSCFCLGYIIYINKWVFVCIICWICVVFFNIDIAKNCIIVFAYKKYRYNKVHIDCNLRKEDKKTRREKTIAIKECNGKYSNTPNTHAHMWNRITAQSDSFV